MLQLRDNLPGIVFPGCWGLFGGHIEPGETPLEALKRAGYGRVIWVFCIANGDPPCLSGSPQGWPGGVRSAKLVPPAPIHRGWHPSVQAAELRPLGEPHQQILLAFLESQGL